MKEERRARTDEETDAWTDDGGKSGRDFQRGIKQASYGNYNFLKMQKGR